MNKDIQISKERGEAYGDYGAMATVAQKLKKTIQSPNHGKLNPAEQEAIDLICTKLARIAHGDPDQQHDTWTDIAGYAKLARDSRPINPTHGNFDVNKDDSYDAQR